MTARRNEAFVFGLAVLATVALIALVILLFDWLGAPLGAVVGLVLAASVVAFVSWLGIRSGRGA